MKRSVTVNPPFVELPATDWKSPPPNTTLEMLGNAGCHFGSVSECKNPRRRVEAALLSAFETIVRAWIQQPPSDCSSTLVKQIEQYCFSQRQQLREIVRSVLQAEYQAFMRGLPGGYVFREPPKSKEDLSYKYETERVLETIPIFDEPHVKAFTSIILRACKRDDVVFFKRLGRILAKKPIGVTAYSIDRIVDWLKKSKKMRPRIAQLLREKWICPVEIVPGLCFLSPEALVEVCSHRLALTEDELSADNAESIRQELGLVPALKKIPIVIVNGKMKIAERLQGR